MTEKGERVAAVTGSARGIGRAIAEGLAEDGMHVAILDVNGEGAEDAAGQIAEKYSVRSWAGQLDVSDQGAVTEVFKRIEAELGPVNVLVNNAGVARDNLLMRMKKEEWDTVLDIHLNGTFHCSQAVIRGMIKQRYGRIINMSSIVGVHGQAGQCNYASAKAGIIGFTKALAQEVASRNITVNAVAPGYIKTAMTEALPEEVLKAFVERIPMRREGAVDDVANAVRFLASDNAAYITGAVLSVDGGMGA
ncbi:MAG TPA: 3-oxoacyl-[acyl-carrier-protein] reductase [Candidatus Hydrogenedentes bacterium]|nr:3-oxoacyl-[acyl-carrier-protein] reductase [Candidatus Hydrogenedentota bacterium]HIJ74135.1 3-oxoacyl-[acyl-carrier-protein] reductase [Candidatus Hydrogenedentota bacterium]